MPRLPVLGSTIRFCTVFSIISALGCGVSRELYDTRTTQLDRCQNEVGQVRSNLNSTRGKLQEMTQSSLDYRDRIAKLENDRQILQTNLSATKSDMEQLRQARAEADEREAAARVVAKRLQQYDGKQLHVSVRRRRLVVTLADSELFAPGEATLLPTAAVPLRALSGLMRELSERDFLVGGHTDNSSPHAGLATFKSNWDLSVSRAVAVVRFLQGEGVDPRHLGAAGFSEFDPIADNDSDAGRARNRRIEVVLLPTVKELPEVQLAPPPAPTTPTVPTTQPSSVPTPSPSPAAATKP